MSIFFSSDHHFGHKKLIDSKYRPFTTVEEMNESLIKTWNKTVSHGDLVYYIGDMFVSCKAEMAAEVLSKLNGKIHYILGNHEELIRKKKIDIKRFEYIKDLVELKTNKKLIVLFHYPIEVWDCAHYGSWHLHGHCHGTLTTNNGPKFDVSIDTYYNLFKEYKPFSFEEIELLLKDKIYTPLDHHK